MKLCVYCGTFNPIHNVHIQVANFVNNNFDFDKILFIPAYKPPHKSIDDKLAKHRFNMVELAIKNNENFAISDIEFQHEMFSYTFNTITELYKIYLEIEGKINFIIGTDAFRKIETWYKADELKDLVKFIVFTREENFNEETLDKFVQLGYNFVCTKMPFNDVSSTEIRSLVKGKKQIGTLVPADVKKYIKENGLYKDEND